MTENEFLLEDRIAKIKATVGKYGEDNFYISYSGGKDSNVLSALVDMALPKNRIPRVYANTGIELNMVRDFVFEQQKHDDRIQVIKPSVPIKKMLEEEGYPFKSKHHAAMLVNFRNNPENKSAWKYLNRTYTFSRFNCPKKLQYQFDASFPLKISDRCCFRLKEEPYAEDIQCVGIRPTSSFTFEMNLTARTYKILNRLAKRGNNWRRLHGKSLIRVPLRERRKRK